MKRLFLILTAVLFAGTLHAQIKFGAKAGITYSAINVEETYDLTNVDEVSLDELSVEQEDFRVGLQGGFFGRLTIVNFYVQPELLFTTANAGVKVTELQNGQATQTIKEQEFNKVDIPIIAGWKFGPARIQAGPVASFVVKNESAVGAVLGNFKEEFNSATWGYQVGVGLDVLKTVTLDVKYEGSLSRLGDQVKIGDSSFDIDSRPRQIIMTVGIFF
jgi:hypothetical protein